jgi:hypothetical protein
MRIRAFNVLELVRKAAVWAISLLVGTLFALWLAAYSAERHWFDHPSTQLAAAMNFAAMVLASPWFHWIGGGIFGFGLGIWIDDLLRRFAAKSPPVPVPPPIEFGFLDYQVDMQDAFRNLNSLLLKFADRTRWIGDEVEKVTSAIVRITKGKETSTRARELKREADKAARQLNRYKQYIEEPCAQFNKGVNRLVAAIEWSLTNRPEKLSQAQIDTLKEAKKPMTFARENVASFISTLKGIKGTSATLNRAIDNACPILDQIATDVERIERLIDAIINSQATMTGS